jgi:predicted SAM-dependent methyltransferase
LDKFGCDEVIVAFCDNDKKKHGKTINEIPVISPKELSNVSFDQVVIASEYVSEIFEQLKKLGLSNRQIALAPRPIHEVQTSKNDQNKFKTSETSKCRESLAPFCKGNGLDIGYGGDPIVPSAICIDLDTPYANYLSHPQHLHGDASSLYWFIDECLDYAYSSHVLEDFIDTEDVLREWSRVLKPGGNLVLFLPDEQAYRAYCAVNGNEPNKHHIHQEFSLNYLKEIVGLIGGLEVIHELYPVAEYSFELVLKKLKV